MRSVDEDADGIHARWLLERAQVRAMARRQLSLSIPIVIAGAFAAVISTFASDYAGAPPHRARINAPISAPATRHVVVLASAGVAK